MLIMIQSTKLIKIGNSQGIRLPKAMINHYGFGEKIELSEVAGGILITNPEQGKLSWQETYQAMQEDSPLEQEEWKDWQEFDLDISK